MMKWNMILSKQWRLEGNFCYILFIFTVHLHAFIFYPKIIF